MIAAATLPAFSGAPRRPDRRRTILTVETWHGATVAACLDHYPQPVAALADGATAIDLERLPERIEQPSPCPACRHQEAADLAREAAAVAAIEAAAYHLADGRRAPYGAVHRHADGYDEGIVTFWAAFPADLTDEEIRDRLAIDGWPLERTGCACDRDGRDCCGQWFSHGATLARGRATVMARHTWSRCL